jgi:hypothetical protein
MSSFIKSFFQSRQKSVFPDPVIVRLTAEYTQTKHGHPFVDESALRFTVDYDLHYACVHAVKAVEVFDYSSGKWVSITSICMEQFSCFFGEIVESINWNRRYVEEMAAGNEEAMRYA